VAERAQLVAGKSARSKPGVAHYAEEDSAAAVVPALGDCGGRGRLKAASYPRWYAASWVQRTTRKHHE
jgi:hypothetical protein